MRSSQSLASLMETFGVHGQTLPSGRFFTPTQAFWDVIEQYRGNTILDAGCGSGDLVDELREKEFTALGCDVNYRDGATGYGAKIQLIDALRFPLTDGMTILTCRPDHGGWCEMLLERAIENNCTFIYIGLEHNLDLDFSEDVDYEIIAKDVGEEGELMLLCNIAK